MRDLGLWVGVFALMVLGCSTAAPDEPVASRQQAVLAATLEDTFSAGGLPVAVSGDTAVIGALDALGPGAVYVRVRSATGTWSEQQKLVPSDVPSFGEFGAAVAIDGNTLVAAAAKTTANSYGAVYVYVRTGTSWSLQQKLADTNNYTFGTAVAISGDRLAIRQNGYIASDGSVHIYERTGTTWAFKSKSIAYSDTALALSGDNLAMTVYAGSDNKNVVVNGQTVMTVPAAAQIALALDGSTLAVGQRGDGGATPGKVRLFSGPSWSDAGTITGDVNAFGSGVSLSGAALLVSSQAGGALYARVGGAWKSTPEYFLGSGSVYQVSLSGLTAIVNASSSKSIYRLAGLAGGACGTAGECIDSAHTCTDSVCCTSPCAGPCEACSVAAGAAKDGTCSPVAKGTPCGAYVCTGASSSCPTSCTADTDCAQGRYCSAAGACVDQKLQGSACVPASDCKNPSTCTVCKPGLSCVEGFCCNGPCAGACDTCSQANGATANGTCTVLGKGATPIPAGGCNGLLCGGGGNAGCPTSCATSADCITNNVCTSGSCVGPKALGSPCAAAGECASNFCVDGVCCNAVCNGQCEACDGGGGNPPGSCTPVVGKPHGNRPQCSGTGLCAGKCGGADPTSCSFPGLGTPCALASCSGDVVQPEGKCDGVGTCTIPNTSNCAPYTCDTATTACTTSCASDAQCAQGSTCDVTTGKCAASAATCVDSATVKLPNGQTQSCAPYKCVAGGCQQQCTADSDCVAGYQCEAPLCLPTSDAGTGGTTASGGASGTGATGTGGEGGSKADSGGDDGGCGCEIPRRGAPPASALALGLLAILAARRRRGRLVG